MDDRRVAVVVGAGASGVLATMRLLATGWCVVLVDPHAGPGRGVADSTASPWHLLNCPVSAISAHPDRPDDFLTWYRMRRCPNTQPCDFVPRHQYGDYLSDTLRQADSSLLTVHRASVTRIFESTGSRLTVLLADGVVIQATHVVLALGHAPAANPLPLRPEVKNSPSYVADPWRRGALTAAVSAADNGQVLLIGAGLTAYDVTQSLVRANSAVRITAVSRHGLTPQPHRRGGGPTVPGAPVTGGPLSHLLRQLRQMAAGYGDWQAVIDAHRPHWNTLWDGLSEPDRDRFLRHVSRWWELHGHRVPPAVEKEIADLRAAGSLNIIAGQVTDITSDPDGRLTVTLRHRDGTDTTTSYAAAINCSGPGRIADSSPLVRSLIAEGLAVPGPHRFGVATDRYGALLRRDGSVNSSLWTLGPPRRGPLWETSAIPEIRDQAHALARRLANPATTTPGKASRRLRCPSPSMTQR